MAAQRDASGAITVVRVAEAEIGTDAGQQVQALLQMCFPGYPSRSYFKLPPHFRYLAMAQGALVGQMGVELRVIRVGSEVLRTFGVVDLCVAQSERSHARGALRPDGYLEFGLRSGRGAWHRQDPCAGDRSAPLITWYQY